MLFKMVKNLEEKVSDSADKKILGSKAIDFWTSSKFSFLRNPVAWFFVGSYLPGEQQEYAAKRVGRPKLFYSITSISGGVILNAGKIWVAYELFQKASQSSSSIAETIEKIGGYGMIAWTFTGIAGIALRSYYMYKTKKPVGEIKTEAIYHGGRGIFYGMKKIYELSKKGINETK